jgi:peptide-methionine (R)-S-oxide reductase
MLKTSLSKEVERLADCSWRPFRDYPERRAPAALGPAERIAAPEGRKCRGSTFSLERVHEAKTMPPKPIDDPSYPVHKSDAEWRQQLDPMQYQVARHAATERAFTGKYWDHFEPGRYDCIGCGTPLFKSDAKFDAGCGWPSYAEPINSDVVERVRDASHGMLRIEVRCRNCGSHLGHVFDDGPAPTGERFCINSAAINFAPPE